MKSGSGQAAVNIKQRPLGTLLPPGEIPITQPHFEVRGARRTTGREVITVDEFAADLAPNGSLGAATVRPQPDGVGRHDGDVARRVSNGFAQHRV